MKQYFLIIILCFASCQIKNEHPEFTTEQVDDINKITELIIFGDSLDVLKNSKGSRMFCQALEKVKIEVPVKQNGIIPPTSPGNVQIYQLLNKDFDGKAFFSKKDSLNLIAQNSNPEKFEIDKIIANKINITSKEKEIAKYKIGKDFNYYNMSIPIFSLDRQRAYVELENHCYGLCGSGFAYYLEKVNGKWIILKKLGTWIS